MISNLIVHLLIILAVCVGLLHFIPGSGATFAQDSPLVLAFYYAWYDQSTWTSGLTAGQPTQAYISSDPAAIERHVSQAQAAGIDALIQSWYGPQEADNQTETNFRTLLDVAAAKNFQVAVDFETTGPFFTDRASVVDAVRYLLSVHAQHTAYLRFQGRPVVFFWRQERFSVDEWAAIRAQVDPNHDSLWIAEGVDIAYQAVFDGHHLYSIAWAPDVGRTLSDWGFRVRRYESQNEVDRLWVATVMPGYDDTRSDRVDAFVVDRQEGDYYRGTWSAAVASQPDWIVITSFNEWLEGTMIEPSLAYGDLYINLTRDLVRTFKPAGGVLDAELTMPTESVTGAYVPGEVKETPMPPYIRAQEAVRVRAGPGTEYPRVGRLSPGETAPVEGRNAESSWWQIEWAGQDDGLGWVTAEFVTFEGNSGSVPVMGDAILIPTRVPLPISTVTPMPSSTPTPLPASWPVPTPSAPPQREAFTPTCTTPPSPTLKPSAQLPRGTFIPLPTASYTPTATPMLRSTPVVQRRPVGLLWMGAGALAVGLGIGVFLLRMIRTKR